MAHTWNIIKLWTQIHWLLGSDSPHIKLSFHIGYNLSTFWGEAMVKSTFISDRKIIRNSLLFFAVLPGLI